MSIALFAVIAFYLAMGTAYICNDRRQRLTFMASLSSQMRERLTEFEAFKGNWKEFRDLQRVDFDPQMRFPP
jgi:hypothetical protein